MVPKYLNSPGKCNGSETLEETLQHKTIYKIEKTRIAQTKYLDIAQTKNLDIVQTKNLDIAQTKNLDIAQSKNLCRYCIG